MNFLQYIIETTLIWAIFFGIYMAFLRKETFFAVNRWYLLISVALGLILPLLRYASINWNIGEGGVSQSMYFIASGSEVIVKSVSGLDNNPEIKIGGIIWFLYLSGVIFLLIRLAKGLYKIHQYVAGGKLVNHHQFTIVTTSHFHLPFSFFKYIFISGQIQLDRNIEDILKHEISHVKQWHSLDILILELLQIVFWFNPLIYFYRKALHEAHEFIADAIVVDKGSRTKYSQLLISNYATGFELALSHAFFTSYLKSRLEMIYRKRSSKTALLKYALVIPIALLLFVMCSKDPLGEKENTVIPEFQSETTNKDVQELFKVVEEMPRFPGCENSKGSLQEIDECANQRMLEYIFSNLKYPQYARTNGIEGMVIIQFVVNRKGKMEDIRLVRDIGGQCGEEALRVVHQMQKEAGNWKPGIQRGKPVNVLYTLPVKFSLNNPALEGVRNIMSSPVDRSDLTRTLSIEDYHQLPPPPPPPEPPPAPPVPPAPPAQDKEEIFKVVEEMPRFPGCEDLAGTTKEIDDCSKQKLIEYISSSLKYPIEAKEKNVEGMVVVQFVVNHRGEIDEVDVVRDIGSGCGQAAKDLIESMKELPQKWTPGRQRGRKVDVIYTLPVRFAIQ